MKRLIAFVLVLLVSIGLFAYSYVIGGTNLSMMGYPSFSASKPYQPYATTTYVSGSYSSVKTVSEWEYDSYKRDVESYVNKAKEFIENGNNDIKRIQNAQQEAIDAANKAIDDFNTWARSVYVK